MKARAPGKILISGAYAVLEGAPSIVAAIDRYVTADTSARANLVTPEVAEALGSAKAPAFDASELRAEGRKLGLGSSAAIVVASVAAVLAERHPKLTGNQLAQLTLEVAAAAHRTAQGGGSGVDVACSAMGGIGQYSLSGGKILHAPHELPQGVCIHVYSLSTPSSTPAMLGKLREYSSKHELHYARLMARLTQGAVHAAHSQTVGEFVVALRCQAVALERLGDCASMNIVPAELRTIARSAFDEGTAVIVSGAGGGDIVLCVGAASDCDRQSVAMTALGLERLNLKLGARGVHLVVDASIGIT